MAPITVDVCQFDAPSGNELTRRQFTFEFEDGLYLNRLPLDLRVGHYWIITKGDPWRLWKDTRWEIINHFGVKYYTHAADFYLSLLPDHFLSMERIVEWGLIIWEKETRPPIQVISTLDLLFMLCCPKQLSIKGNLFRLARVAGIRLRQLLTGSNEFRVGALDYDYKPDFSEFINSSTEDTHTPTSPPGSRATSERPNRSLSSNIAHPVDAEEARDGDMAVTTEAVPHFIQ